MLYGLAVVAALVAIGSGAAPTGIGLVDRVYAGGAGAMLAMAGSRSRRWTWIASSIAAVWVAGEVLGVLLALLALGIAVASAWWGRTRWMGAALTVPLLGTLGGLDSGSFHGSTTIVALAIAAPILLSASFHLTDSGRQTLFAALTIAGGFVVLATVMIAATAFLARGDLNTAIDDARDGFDVASAGNEAQAAEHFDAAAEGFRSARRLMGGPWTLPARLVPVIGQHARAGQVMVSEGVNLAETAAEVSRRVDIDSIRVVNGRVDLAAVDALTAPLDQAERALERAVERIHDARDEWLISAVDDRMSELAERLDGALPAARTAALAASETPTLLGRDRPVRWFVALITPAEARGLGGLLGNYATVIADDGQLAIESVGRNEDINALLADADPQLVASDDYVERWGRFRPEELFQDVTLSPDLPSVAAVAASLYEQATGDRVDGVIVADPYVVGALLSLTGPVDAAGRSMGATGVVDFLLRDQYEEYEDDEPGRVLVLESIITSTFDALIRGTLPGPRGLADALGPMVMQDRLGAWWADGGGPEELFVAAGLDGRFPDAEGGDLVGVIHQNRGQNKIDVYLERRIDYVATRDGNRISGSLTITLDNTAPGSGLPDAVIGSNDQDLPPGTNAMHLSVYTALEVLAVRVGDVEQTLVRQSELGAEVVSFEVQIPPESEVVVEVEMAGTVDDPERLTVVQQPLVNPDIFSARPEQLGATPGQASRPLRVDTVLTVAG